jgi:protein-S-isoprenylcysteine O-methyltransferase Ste14
MATLNQEWMFRAALAAGMLIVFPVAAYHRLRARTGEALDRRQEGLAPAMTLRLAGLGHMLGLLCHVIWPEWIEWASVTVPTAVRWAGAPLGAAAAGLIGWTLRHLGSNLTDTVVTRRRHTLVTSGPYRFVRHPFYAGAGLAMLANSLLAANIFLLTTGATVFALMVRRTRREEANLLARFGDDYRRYSERAGRILPKLSS